MGRTHESVEQWEFPEGTNVWEAVRAADAYVRLRVGLDKSYQAGVFDGRGHIFEDDLHKAYAGWQEQSSPLKSVVVSYGDTLVVVGTTIATVVGGLIVARILQ